LPPIDEQSVNIDYTKNEEIGFIRASMATFRDPRFPILFGQSRP
jgi:hypothetical protein